MALRLGVHPLKAACAEQGRQLQWLAIQLGVTPRRLSAIMLGDVPAPPDFYQRAAVILNVPVERITAP